MRTNVEKRIDSEHPCSFCTKDLDECYECAFAFHDSGLCKTMNCMANFRGCCKWGVSTKCKARTKPAVYKEDYRETD